MRSSAAIKVSASTSNYRQPAKKPHLSVVSPAKEAPQVQSSTSPDFEDFMNKYGMWSDFA